MQKVSMGRDGDRDGTLTEIQAMVRDDHDSCLKLSQVHLSCRLI